MQLRMEGGAEANQEAIKKLAAQRLMLRRLSWSSDFSGLSGDQRAAVAAMIPGAVADFEAVLANARDRERKLKDTQEFRSLVRTMELAAVISLHLSSHGDGVGAFNRGWMYPLKPAVNRISPYSLLDEVLDRAAAETEAHLGLNGFYHDTLRPSRLRSWESYFLDRPFLGGEVSSLAGMLGITLVTCDDGRPYWGTPYDTPGNGGHRLCRQAGRLCRRPDPRRLPGPRSFRPTNCRATGLPPSPPRPTFLRQGELFADQPAPGTMILAFQGLTRHYAMVDASGDFQLKGVAWYKLVIHKVIIEGYRFDPRQRPGRLGHRQKTDRQGRLPGQDAAALHGDQAGPFRLPRDHPVQPAGAPQLQLHDQNSTHRRPARSPAPALLVQPDRHLAVDPLLPVPRARHAAGS